MKKFNILIIDDNAVDRSTLQEILVSNDYIVQTTDSGKSGLLLLNEESYDLVIMEAGMPAGEGFSSCLNIKSNPSMSNTPVIFIVGHDDLAMVKDIYESGGDDYILRPFAWSELLVKTRVQLELRYSREIARNLNQILESKVSQRTTELEYSLNQLRQAKKELENLAIAKSEFLNLISHEIRTPLNGIIGSMALIGRYHFSDEVNRYFSLLDTSVRRLEKFSNTILEASTLRIKGEKALIFIELDILNIFQLALNQCIDKFKEKSIEIVIENNTSNSMLEGDHKYLTKCFTAILENAFKFSPKGETVEISLTNKEDGF